MEDIICIFCNIRSAQIVIEENGYYGRKCPNCGLIFISPRPTSGEVLNLYAHDRAHVSAESHIRGRFGKGLCGRHNIAIIKGYIKSGSLLEIGAGAGYFLDKARKEGFEVCGIEFNRIQADFINNILAIPCEVTALGESSFGGRKFNIIYHSDVISHFYDPIAEFQKMNEKLKQNGILVFETGNLGDVKEEYFRFITKFQYPDHLFFFGENNLKELLKLTGFELVKIYRYSILLQLVIDKVLKKVVDLIKSKSKTENIDKRSITEGRLNIYNSNISGFRLKQLIKNTHRYLSYIVRYKIGYLMPKEGRPQTVIVIARKRK